MGQVAEPEEPKASALKLADSADFDLLGNQLGNDVKLVLESALTAGVTFPVSGDPLSIFRNTLRESIRSITGDGRGDILRRFLQFGPYEGMGEIPAQLSGKRLTKDETAVAITFIYSFMVNSFKGAITELLAAGACQRLMQGLCLAGTLPPLARLYVGDAVMVLRKSGKGGLKGADLYILIVDNQESKAPHVHLAGVTEVKSGHKSANAMSSQIEKHILRSRQGLLFSGANVPGDSISVGLGPESRVIRITVQPSDWRLPHELRFEPTEDGRQLMLDPPVPPFKKDQLIPLGGDRWHLSLRWSKEALAEAAFEMTFWYMGKIGEIIYTKKDDEPEPKPKGWEEMNPAEAGRNAVKMMLYYAIQPYESKLKDKDKQTNPEPGLSRKDAGIRRRAIALYNSYCFGYALGMNFRNKDGGREMMWPQDLDEIALNGCNRDGCRVV